MKPQNVAVLRLLRAHPEGITPALAQEVVGTTRLAARIADLKADGFDVRSTLLTVPTRGGGTARVALYTLREQPEQLALGVA